LSEAASGGEFENRGGFPPTLHHRKRLPPRRHDRRSGISITVEIERLSEIGRHGVEAEKTNAMAGKTRLNTTHVLEME
jgi:hypothetical protein